MKFILRPYQTQAVIDALKFMGDINAGRSSSMRFRAGAMVLPTGSGKSLIISEIAKKAGINVLVLQPSKELLMQNHKKYLSYGLKNSAIYSASLKSKKIAQVTFATPSSIYSAIKKLKKNGLDPKKVFNYSVILQDEAHLGSAVDTTIHNICNELLTNGLKGKDAFTMKCIIGLTATPFRLASTMGGAILRTFNNDYKCIISNVFHTTQIQVMTKNNYWTPVIYKTPKTNKRSLRLNSSGTDYLDRSVSEYWMDNDIHEKCRLLVPWLKERGYKNTLVFAPSVKDAKILEELSPDFRAIYGDMDSKLRDSLIEDFKNGKIFGLVNVNVLGTGFDFPELESVIHGRPTQSLAIWYQHVGRLVRIAKGKTSALIVDLSGNFEKFGRVEDLVFEPIRTGATNGTERYNCHKNGIQLTNIPIDEIGTYMKGEYETVGINKLSLSYQMPWGKYKGEEIGQLPDSMLRWLSGDDFKAINIEAQRMKVTATFILANR